MSKRLCRVGTTEDFFSLMTILKRRLSHCLGPRVHHRSQTFKRTWGDHDERHIWRDRSPEEEEENDHVNDVLNELVPKHSCTISWRRTEITFLHIQTQASSTWRHSEPQSSSWRQRCRNNWYGFHGCRGVKRHERPRRRRRSCSGGPSDPRDKAALTFNWLINFSER